MALVEERLRFGKRAIPTPGWQLEQDCNGGGIPECPPWALAFLSVRKAEASDLTSGAGLPRDVNKPQDGARWHQGQP